MWGVIWYVNAAKSNLKQIGSIIVSAYKIALGLPRNSSNMVCWKFSNQPFFNSRVIQCCDRFLCRASQLCKARITNKIKYLHNLYNSGRIAPRNVPLLISRWSVVEPKTNFLFKSKIHPYFAFPFKDRFIISEFDLRMEG